MPRNSTIIDELSLTILSILKEHESKDGLTLDDIFKIGDGNWRGVKRRTVYNRLGFLCYLNVVTFEWRTTYYPHSVNGSMCSYDRKFYRAVPILELQQKIARELEVAL